MNEIRERLERLSPAKRALLEQGLLKAAQGRAATPPIPRRSPGNAAPLSFAEERLWLLDQLQPGHPFYNVPVAARLTGPFDETAFARALAGLVARHETLRTTFPAVEGRPVRRVAPAGQSGSLPFPIAAADLRELAPADRDAQLKRLVRQHSREPFDLTRGPLLRAAVLRPGDDERVVLLVLHHIVCDGWSMNVVLRELAVLYEAAVRGVPAPLAPLDIQYSDFAAWQRERLAGGESRRLLDYWKERLGDGPPALELPTDRPRPAAPSFEGAAHAFAWPAELSARVRRFALHHATTTFAVLMAAYQAVLGRFGRQEDVAVGTAVAGRTRKELEDLIGFFVNTVVVRSDLSGEATFAQAVRNVHDQMLGAHAHQEVPFDKLVGHLAPGRRRDQDPLFQAAMVLQNAPLRVPTASGLTIEPLVVDNGTAKHDLTLYVWEQDGRLAGYAEYRTALFEPSSISRLVGSIEVLLDAAVARPDGPLWQLPLMTAAERRRVLAEFSQCGADAGPAGCLHELFEVQAGAHPERPAVCHAGREATYGELNRRANRIARWLRARGVGAEQLVAVCLPRSADLVAAMLGVLKAGAAYLPVEPEQAPARRATLLDDARPTMIIDREAMAAIDAESQALADSARDWPVDPGQVAYVIYTSGSTGRPKGVLVEHRGAAAFIRAQGRVVELPPETRYLQFFAPTFDGSIAEIFGALAQGACLAIPEPETCRDAEALEAFIRQERVTAAQLTPSMLQALRPDAVGCLSTIVSAGEAITPELVARWSPGRRLFNAYGPTETSIGACMARLDGNDHGGRRPPIGRPLDGARVYVLDGHGQPVPPGAPGEIVLGGTGVARGYLNRPELTAERFAPDPLADDPAARMYRSGDLGRWREDGQLEFLGRVDDQVKVRGFRVEPGEVAAAIEEHPRVAQAAVLARGDASGSQQLTAYVVPRSESVGGDADGAALEQEHLDYWRSLFDATFRQTPPPADPTLHVAGWVSSRTGRPLPRDEMREWAEAAAQRILALRPRHVLEIGCKTGLVLFRVAPHCRWYVGTDPSGATIEWLRTAVDRRRDLRHRVRLRAQPADQASGLRRGRFDLAVLSSAVQYFPSVDYLLRVLEGIQPLVGRGGRILLTDLRGLALDRTLAASIELAQADESLGCDDLRRRIAARIERQQELLVDPRLFGAIRSRLSRVAAVEFLLKRGRATNEIAQYRYDALLHLDAAQGEPDAIGLDWEPERPGADRIAQVLTQENPEALVLRGVLNGRLVRDLTLCKLLDDPRGPATVGELRSLLAGADLDAGMDPEDFWRLGERLGWQASVRPADSGDVGRYDVVFHRAAARRGRRRPVAVSTARQARQARRTSARRPGPSRQAAVAPDWHDLANDPLAGVAARRVMAEVRESLRSRLPDYMMPTRFVMVPSLPRTPSGKLDRKALPSPPSNRADWSAGYVAPRNDEETLVAQVWERLLGVSPIGATDDFFELGGHSMLAVRMIAAIEERTGRRLPLAALFQEATVEHLARLLRERDACPADSSLVPLQREGAGAPFFAVHPAGGTVFCYQPLALHLGQERPFYGIQAVGLDGVLPPHETVDQMVSHYITAVRSVQPHGPYYLGGWSLGGNLAFEIARRLAEAGEPIALLALFDSGALPPDREPTEEDFLPVVMALFPGDDDLTLDELRRMGPQEHLEYFSQRALKAGIVLPTVNVEAAGHVFDVFKGNLKAMWEYRPRAYPGRITLLASQEQPETIDIARDPCLGWAAYAQGGVEVHCIPGRHLDIIREPNVRVLAEKLSECLRRAAEGERVQQTGFGVQETGFRGQGSGVGGREDAAILNLNPDHCTLNTEP